MTMIHVDGGEGEGGGQILRTSLALAISTRTPVRIHSIRKGRERPGLMRQHLAAVHAAAAVGGAEVKGAELGSKEVVFSPGEIVHGEHTFRIGSAGSTSLVLQTVLPALLCAKGPSVLVLEGGTDNTMAPPFEFLALAFLPLVRRMGPTITAAVEQRGFYPAGGGRVRVTIDPSARLARLDLLERGAVLRQSCTATVANLPSVIAKRELARARELLGWDRSCFHVEMLTKAPGPGNILHIVIEAEHVTEVFTGFGEKGVRSEIVAERAAGPALDYLAAGAPVGEHLADQLLLPMALGGGGSFRSTAPSSHTKTHVRLLEQILGVRIRIEADSERTFRVEVG